MSHLRINSKHLRIPFLWDRAVLMDPLAFHWFKDKLPFLEINYNKSSNNCSISSNCSSNNNNYNCSSNSNYRFSSNSSSSRRSLLLRYLFQSV